MTSVLEGLIPGRADEPGIAAALLTGGRIIAQRCVGLADLARGEPIGPRTRFHIVSASKTFVAATILALAADGRLGLDDPVRRHLPELRQDAVTIRHLLSMTSGLRDVLEIMRLRGEWRSSPSRVRELLDLAYAQTEVSAAAGAQYMYANVNFVLLEEVVRRLAGDADAFRQEVLYRPLGLVATADRPHEEIVLPGLAQPYVADGAGGWTRPTDLLGIAGDTLTTCLEDMTRWLLALDRRRVGDLDLQPMAVPSRLNDGTPIHYGLGLCIRPYRGLAVIGHTGSQPGYKTHVAYVPARDVGVVILSNREDTRPSIVAAEILAAVLGDDGFPSRPPPITPRDAIDWSGTYVDPASGEWMQLSQDEHGGLAAETLGDPLSLQQIAPGRYRHREDYRADTPTEAVFVKANGVVTCRLTRGGQLDAMLRQSPPVLADSDLSAFTGIYENATIDCHHSVALDRGKLTVLYGADRLFPIQPIAPDTFLVRPTAPGVAHKHVFRFRRDSGGAVAEVLVTLDRLKGVTLHRVAA